ncbi:MAG: hypothetical protein GC201_08785 [Alphaproteobacteria bacterium]|nr:hypothetical protein [Alphaproteobacteria bacterium]
MNRAALALLAPILAFPAITLAQDDGGEPRRTILQRVSPASSGAEQSQPERASQPLQTAPPQRTPAPGTTVPVAGAAGLALRDATDAPYQLAPGAIAHLKGAAPAQRKLTKAMFDLPFFGNELVPGERFYVGKKIHSPSGSQMWGYDIGAMRKKPGTDQWSEVRDGTDWKNPKNSDYFVYGKPVYAMADGTVIRCWRNAPQNPRPFSSALGDSFDEPFEQRDWLHQKWRDGMMSGAGNHLLVLQDDGNLVLYAHAQTGSIPSSLCPHDQQLYSKAGADSEADVPAAQQVRIHAGQQLYLAGNSGNSSAPHLHVHQQDEDGNPIQFAFRRGLSTPVVSGNHADIDKWTRFAGSRIPDGPVLFWPPEPLGGEYSRHGYAAADFQRMFDHLADSGFWPEWLDGYSVGGKAYLNFTWRPAKGAWRAFFLLTPQQYQSNFDTAKGDGYAPVMVDSSLVGGQPRYSVIFVKDKPGGYIARHGLTYDQHMAVMAEAKGKHLYPVDISVVSVGGEQRYTVLWRSENIGGWVVKSQVPEAQYQGLYDEQAQSGRRPSYVNAYMHQGKAYYSVVFAQVPGARKDRHAMTAGQYQAEFDGAMNQGLPTRATSGYDGAQQNHRFIAFWRQ